MSEMAEMKQSQTINRRAEEYCEECGKNSFQIDEIRGEVVCRNCGVVNRGKLIDFVER